MFAALLLCSMATVLITGGSGLIGSALTAALLTDGHAVRHLSRTHKKAGPVRTFLWDVDGGQIDAASLDGVDHIVHLSGAGIADKRWTDARMRELHASRGGAARLLLKIARQNRTLPKSFISASGIGYYGAITSPHVFNEADPPCDDAIARLTRDWEAAADEWSSTCRVVKLRTPMVLARDGGALKRLSLPFRFGLGAALGTGRQWMPWVHIDDLVGAYVRSITDERLNGAYNVAAAEQPVNKDFMRAVARALDRPFFLPNVPAFALRLALGEMSGILLHGSRASGSRARSAGMIFRYDDLHSALKDTLWRG